MDPVEELLADSDVEAGRDQEVKIIQHFNLEICSFRMSKTRLL